jgi:hypothetical protein
MSLETAKNAADAIVRQTDVNLIAAASAKALVDLIEEVQKLRDEVEQLKAQSK